MTGFAPETRLKGVVAVHYSTPAIVLTPYDGLVMTIFGCITIDDQARPQVQLPCA